jgi:hypothetical protein
MPLHEQYHTSVGKFHIKVFNIQFSILQSKIIPVRMLENTSIPVTGSFVKSYKTEDRQKTPVAGHRYTIL